jgi:hypothetical protein
MAVIVAFLARSAVLNIFTRIMAPYPGQLSCSRLFALLVKASLLLRTL